QQYYSNLNKYDTDKWIFYSNQSNLSVSDYTYFGCAKDTTNNENCTETRSVNTIITTPIIVYPINNTPIIDSTPTLIWNNSLGGGTTKTYQLILDNDSTFSSPNVNVTINETTESTNYTLTTDLTVDKTYYWEVQAYDTKAYSNWSIAQFDLLSSVAVSLPRTSVDFGNMTAGEQKNTTQAGLAPLVISNDGNIPINISVNATALFTSTNPDLPGLYQFNITMNETNAYNSILFSTWMDLNSTEMPAIDSLKQENTTNTANRANMDIKIKIPSDQGGGNRSSLIYIKAVSSG
ncbi:hypothetical protein HYX11_04080, partial [Candidatus Woesearchaeota archaeon]|nr:hypothetical protein [Candidatus Woesearchaeota archaeon]